MGILIQTNTPTLDAQKQNIYEETYGSVGGERAGVLRQVMEESENDVPHVKNTYKIIWNG